MSRGNLKAVEDRAKDLQQAVDAIARVADDTTITPRVRLQQISGILRMYATPTVTP